MTAKPFVITTLDLAPRKRLRVSLDADRRRIEMRTLDRLASRADIWTPTRDGFALDLTYLASVTRALIDAEAQVRAMGLIAIENEIASINANAATYSCERVSGGAS